MNNPAEFFGQYDKLARQIESRTEEIERQRSLCTKATASYSDMPSSGAVKSQIEENLVRLETLYEKLAQEQEEQRVIAMKQRATARAMELQVQTLAPSLKSSDDVILLSPLLKPWVEGSYGVGDIVSFGGIPKRCAQAHNSTGNPSWNPKDAPSLWAAFHGSTLETALPYEQPLGAHDAYKKGEMIADNGKFLRCNKDNTVYPPSQLPGAWDVVS